MSGSKRGFWWLGALAPFAWILLIPIVTASAQSGLLENLVDHGKCIRVNPNEWEDYFYDEYRCPREDVLPTLLPGLLNLMAFVPVLPVPFQSRLEVRWAAIAAGTLGAVRLAAPLLIYTASGPYVEVDYSSSMYTYGPGSSVAVSFALWCVSLFCAFALFVMFALGRSTEMTTKTQLRPEDQCRNCGHRLTVDDKMRRNRGTGLCWDCFLAASSSSSWSSRTGRQD